MKTPSLSRTSFSISLTFTISSILFPISAQEQPQLIKKKNQVEASPPPRQPFVEAEEGRKLEVNEIVAARKKSRAVVEVSRKRHLRIRAESQIRILKSYGDESKVGLEVQKGDIYLHSREDWVGAYIRTRTVTAWPKGTQFVVSVANDGTTTFTVLEGSVFLKNDFGEETLDSNEQALVRPGSKPKKTAVIDVRKTVQWCLYYPAIVNLDELQFSSTEKRKLHQTIKAYRSGDLLAALNSWPKSYRPLSESARALRAMLLLSVGEIDEVRPLLKKMSSATPSRIALEELIEAVTARGELGNPIALDLNHTTKSTTRQTDSDSASSMTSMEWLARSYYEQAQSKPDSLQRAYEAARTAVQIAPYFGFARVRLAELEFSFGRNFNALSHLKTGLKISPRNPQAWSLTGFIRSSRNDYKSAEKTFNQAISIDGDLGNAWLGRGLVKMKRGRIEDGYRDIRTAVALEPNRAFFHSYLGKAASLISNRDSGLKDLAFARKLDRNDPTPSLYSSLIHRDQYRYNEAIRELQNSIDLNDNRRLYRSQFLLDQDRAVRSANLASLFQNNGMTSVAVREATRAVESDYTNASSHLFLANSFDNLRDPTRIELRYETPWFHELLMANLLSPVGGGPLSQFVSQQEYSKLFHSEGLGASLHTEWRSDDELLSTASIFGNFGNTSFGIDAHYRDDDGDRPNSNDERLEIYAQLKHQLTPNDTIYFLGKFQDQENGDTLRNYNNSSRSPDLRFQERQEPGLLLAGWNHRWGPGSHTLFLGGRLSANQTLTDPSANQLLLTRDANALRPGFAQTVGNFDQFTNPNLNSTDIILGTDGSQNYSPALLQSISPFLGQGNVTNVSSTDFDFATKREFTLYSAELQHIQTLDEHTILLGGRYQSGKIKAQTTLNVVRPNFSGGFPTPAVAQSFTTDFERISAYTYDFWSPTKWLTLVGGLSYDWIDHPSNFRNPPLSGQQTTDEEFSGKIGFTLTPSSTLTIRGLFAEALGGVTFDESVTLEPVQLAGFSQAYRTVLSESLVGSVETPRFRTWGLTLEGQLPFESDWAENTWWGISFQNINQDVSREIGVFQGYNLGVFPTSPAFFPGTTPQELSYEEQALDLTLNKLLGDQFAVGASYRLTRSTLDTSFPEISATVSPIARTSQEATLHHASLFGIWNSPSGLYSRLEGHWYRQSVDDPSGVLLSGQTNADESFFHLNAFLGYRFNENQGDIRLGVLNLFDKDYQLSPLSPFPNLARERTFTVRCRLNF